MTAKKLIKELKAAIFFEKIWEFNVTVTSNPFPDPGGK